VSSFYDEAEIVEAKNCLFTWLSNANLGFDDVPRNKPRKAGDNKRKHDTDDIMVLLEYLDLKKVLLPVFVAKKLSRLPAVQPNDVDLYKLTDTVNDVKVQIREMQNVLKSMSDNQACLANTVSTVASTVASQCDTSERNKADKVHPNEHVPAVASNSESACIIEPDNQDLTGEGTVDQNELSKSFADMFGSSENGDNWFPVRPPSKKLPVQPRTTRKIIGANEAAELRVKAVANQGGWHIFAGRLLPTTTEDDMRALLEDQGIKVVSCQLLPKRAGWQQKFSAFHVVVDIRDKDNVFNEARWPAGTDVRDWWFKTVRS